MMTYMRAMQAAVEYDRAAPCTTLARSVMLRLRDEVIRLEAALEGQGWRCDECGRQFGGRDAPGVCEFDRVACQDCAKLWTRKDWAVR